MSTLFGHTWDDETCYLHTLPPESDPPFQSPAQILSPDILLQIFEWAQSADAGPDHPGFSESEYFGTPTERTIFSRVAVPWNVSQVCRAWRVVAVESAKLWSIIVVHDGTSAFGKPSKMRDNLKWYLERSRRAPLTISAKIFDRNTPKDMFPLRIFFQRVFSERSRWKRVSISSRDAYFPKFPSTSSNCFDNFPKLEELALVFPAGHRENSPISLNFSTCKKLQKLYLLGDFRIAQSDTAMEHLKQVELGSESPFPFLGHYMDSFPSLLDCETLLRVAPSLTSLTIEIRGDDMDKDNSVIYLPYLESFRFQITSGGSEVVQRTHLFVDKLVTPALKNLHIKGDIEPAIEGLLRRSNCSLLSLTIDGETEEGRTAVVEGWLQYMKTLRTLKVEFAVIRSRVLAKLVLSGRGRDKRFRDAEYPELKGLRERDSCPALETMELESCRFEGDIERMAKLTNAMIRSRIRNADGSRGAMESLELRNCSFIPPGLDTDDDLPEERPSDTEVLKLVRDGIDNECTNATTRRYHGISLEVRNQVK
ncbi:hypothetical protein SCHPADRAFT_932256 [Schizopora paradoxa]|uniref:F-box domain-containing protein n=1 Tax=Schizopora paradoxa TaxID=27342 RepID=A0A0H2R7B2_9AGAM|nr:hypothetical protein SCHPADRAFT_932256 [Schizopora paradoxa]